MSGRKPVIAWDSCVLIALLEGGYARKPEQYPVIQRCWKMTRAGDVALVVSAVSLVEVMRHKQETDFGRATREEIVESVTRSNNVLRRVLSVPPADVPTMILAERLRGWTAQNKKQHAGVITIATPDAIHLATAVRKAAVEFWTFDEEDKPDKGEAGLIPLNGTIPDCGSLRICYPSDSLVVTEPKAGAPGPDPKSRRLDQGLGAAPP